MLLSHFQYQLPKERIAYYPADARDQARLLQLNRRSGAIDSDSTVSQLAHLARDGDVWVINDTKVRPARIHLQKESGGRVELLVTRLEDSRATAMYRSSKALRPGQILQCLRSEDQVTVLENKGNGFVLVDLGENGELVLERAGQIPLPPYIEREPEALDAERYQTVYANPLGAVAAPTAGLHFTPELMSAMEDQGAAFARITLHVGPGTFRPIREERIDNHQVGSEHYRVGSDAANLISHAKRVVAVGTTSVRTLESLALDNGAVQAGEGETNLYIKPGYRFKAVDALLTNFHLPGSSLIVLVAAFAGVEAVMTAYQQALSQGFRFYSYGDAMFIS